MPSDLHQRASLPKQIVDRSMLLNHSGSNRPNDFERILAHRINCQRATASLSSRVASKQLSKYRHGRQDCQHLEIRNSNISTTVHPLPLSRLKSMRCEPTVQSSAIFAKDCRAAILTMSLGQR